MGQCFHSWDQTRSQYKQWHGPSACVCVCVCSRRWYMQPHITRSHTNRYSRINPYNPDKLFDLCSLLYTHWPGDSFHKVNLDSFIQDTGRSQVNAWTNLQHAQVNRQNHKETDFQNFTLNAMSRYIWHSKLDLTLFQVCGAGSVFWFPHLCDHSAGLLSVHLLCLLFPRLFLG